MSSTPSSRKAVAVSFVSRSLERVQRTTSRATQVLSSIVNTVSHREAGQLSSACHSLDNHQLHGKTSSSSSSNAFRLKTPLSQFVGTTSGAFSDLHQQFKARKLKLHIASPQHKVQSSSYYCNGSPMSLTTYSNQASPNNAQKSFLDQRKAMKIERRLPQSMDSVILESNQQQQQQPHSHVLQRSFDSSPPQSFTPMVPSRNLRAEERLFSNTSSLSSTINVHYEEAMNIVSAIENKKFNLSESHHRRGSSTIFSMQSPCVSRRNSYSNEETSEDFETIRHLTIDQPQLEPVELSTKELHVNVHHAQALEFFYVFAAVKFMPTPARITIKTQHAKLKVFMSKSVSFPSSFSHDDIFQAHNIRVEEDNGRRQFAVDNIYLGILSETEQDVRISVRFGCAPSSSAETHTVLHKYSSVARLLPTAATSLGSGGGGGGGARSSLISMKILEQDVAAIKERRKRRVMEQRSAAEKDFQQTNIQQADQLTNATVRHHTEQRCQALNSRLREVVEKKRQIDEQEFFRRDCVQRSREFQRQIKLQAQSDAANKKHITSIANSWMRIIHSIQGFLCFRSRMQTIIRERKNLRSAFTLKSKVMMWRHKLTALLPRIESRIMLKSAHVLQLRSSMLCKSIKKESARVITHVLVEFAVSHSLNARIQGYIKTINNIIKKWRDFRVKQHSFQILLGFLFQKYYSTVLESIVNQVDQHKTTSLLLKARKIDKSKTEEMKNEFVRLYEDQRKKEYSSDLLKYFVNQQKFDCPKKIRIVQALMQSSRKENTEESDIDFFDLQTNEFPRQFEQQLEKVIFEKRVQSTASSAIIQPRYFVVPAYEKLKQVIITAFLAVQDKEVIAKLQAEQAKYGWNQAKIIAKLIFPE